MTRQPNAEDHQGAATGSLDDVVVWRLPIELADLGIVDHEDLLTEIVEKLTLSHATTHSQSDGLVVVVGVCPLQLSRRDGATDRPSYS